LYCIVLNSVIFHFCLYIQGLQESVSTANWSRWFREKRKKRKKQL